MTAPNQPCRAPIGRLQWCRLSLVCIHPHCRCTPAHRLCVFNKHVCIHRVFTHTLNNCLVSKGTYLVKFKRTNERHGSTPKVKLFFLLSSCSNFLNCLTLTQCLPVVTDCSFAVHISWACQGKTKCLNIDAVVRWSNTKITP